MYAPKMKFLLAIALALATAMSLGACNRKTDDTVRAPGSSTSTNSSGASSDSGAMAPSGGASATRP